MSRTGWRLPVLGGRGRVKGVRRAGPVKVPGRVAVKEVPAAAVVEETREVPGPGTGEANAGEAVDAAAARRERFARARKR